MSSEEKRRYNDKRIILENVRKDLKIRIVPREISRVKPHWQRNLKSNFDTGPEESQFEDVLEKTTSDETDASSQDWKTAAIEGEEGIMDIESDRRKMDLDDLKFQIGEDFREQNLTPAVINEYTGQLQSSLNNLKARRIRLKREMEDAKSESEK